MTSVETSGETTGSEIQAVARVGQICALFSAHTSELTAMEVAEQIGLNRTTAYRYCVSLVTAGILERGQRRGTFALGALMLELGTIALGRRRVADIAPRYLVELSTAVRMSAVLSLWGTHSPVVAHVEEDRSRTVVMTVRAGTQLDRHAAQSHVFLAHHRDAQALAWMTQGATSAQRAELEAAVLASRRNGYSIATQPGGGFTAAAPIFDEGGIAATIGVLSADSTTELHAGSPVMSELLRIADALSEELGGDAAGHRSAGRDGP